ncbi:MAG: HAD-IA family hydrolase [Candidatus Saccharimonadales bacterium]
MIKAVIFDCFGVLAEDGWTPFKRKYIGNNKAVAREVADLGKQNDSGMLSYEDMIAQTAKLLRIDPQILRDAVGRKVPNEELFVFITTKLKPQYKIGLLTNASYDVRRELFTEEQAAVFDASVLSVESGLTKSDPRMYELMVQRLGVDVSECLCVDDVERYVTAAQDAGMTSIWYQTLEQLEQDITQRLGLQN